LASLELLLPRKGRQKYKYH